MVTLSPYITVTRARGTSICNLRVTKCHSWSKTARGWLYGGTVKAALLFNSRSGEIAA